MLAPSYSLVATAKTVTFYIVPADGYTYYRLFFRRSDSMDMIVSGLAFANVTESFSYVVTDLEPNTEYTANVYFSTDTTDPENIVIGAQTISTKLIGRPANWAWTTTISKGEPIPKYGENIAPITADEWIAFCSSINLFREYKLLEIYSFELVSKGAPITAVIINQAINAISDISGHGDLPTQSNVTAASFWLRLAEALNAIT